MKNFGSRICIYATALCILFAIALVSFCFFTPFSTNKEMQYLYIDADDTADSVLNKLRPGANRHSVAGLNMLFRHSSYLENVYTGYYVIEPNESTLDIFRKLKKGLQQTINLTIPQVRTINQLSKVLAQQLMLDSITIAKALSDSTFCANYGYDTATIKALFIPNTYQVYWNINMGAFMSRMQREHIAFWNSTRRDKAEAIGLTELEVSILASIIDEETNNIEEKPIIAGLYYNRLQKGMLLQADPTVKYALGDFTIKRILNSMLCIESPYNTYLYDGLPPAPITIPSISGIDAVLNYIKHNYYYMCAKEDFSGTHNFARTLGEHLINARHYSQALNERGIK